jgi:hypothetical protein
LDEEIAFAMISAALSSPEAPERAYDPVLRWLIFTGVSVFAAVALWRYGLVRLMVASDRTGISSVIAGLYVAASLHGLYRAFALSRETAAAFAMQADWARRAPVPPVAWLAQLPPGRVADHMRALAQKADTQGAGVLDQSLLLLPLAQDLRAGLDLGRLASDILMRLGLLGTIIGFILMLGPVAGLDADDAAAVRAGMSVMGDGMAVAMYTTLAGLIGSILVRAQAYMLELAAAAAFWDAVRWSETRLIPALGRIHV